MALPSQLRVGDIAEFHDDLLFVLGITTERGEALVARLQEPFWSLALKFELLTTYGPPSDDLAPWFSDQARLALPTWGWKGLAAKPPLPPTTPPAAWHARVRQQGVVVRFLTFDSQAKLGKPGRPGIVVSTPAYTRPAVIVVPLSYGGQQLPREHSLRDPGPARVQKGTFAQAKLAAVPLGAIYPPSDTHPLGLASEHDFNEARRRVDQEMGLGLAW